MSPPQPDVELLRAAALGSAGPARTSSSVAHLLLRLLLPRLSRAACLGFHAHRKRPRQAWRCTSISFRLVATRTGAQLPVPRVAAFLLPAGCPPALFFHTPPPRAPLSPPPCPAWFALGPGSTLSCAPTRFLPRTPESVLLCACRFKAARRLSTAVIWFASAKRVCSCFCKPSTSSGVPLLATPDCRVSAAPPGWPRPPGVPGRQASSERCGHRVRVWWTAAHAGRSLVSLGPLGCAAPQLPCTHRPSWARRWSLFPPVFLSLNRFGLRSPSHSNRGPKGVGLLPRVLNAAAPHHFPRLPLVSAFVQRTYAPHTRCASLSHRLAHQRLLSPHSWRPVPPRGACGTSHTVAPPLRALRSELLMLTRDTQISHLATHALLITTSRTRSIAHSHTHYSSRILLLTAHARSRADIHPPRSHTPLAHRARARRSVCHTPAFVQCPWISLAASASATLTHALSHLFQVYALAPPLNNTRPQ